MNKQPLTLALGTAMVLASGLYGSLVGAQITEPVGAAAVSSELTGEVTVVNPDTRMMTIKTPAGVYEVLHIPEGVKDLDDIDIGDELKITSTEAVLVDIHKGVDAGLIGSTATRTVEPAADEPAATITDNVTLRGQILKVDKEHSTVTVQGSDGPLTLKVGDPMLLSDLAAGDGVVAHYTRVVTGEIQD